MKTLKRQVSNVGELCDECIQAGRCPMYVPNGVCVYDESEFDDDMYDY